MNSDLISNELKWGRPCRLRNLLTGKFLSVAARSGGNTSVLGLLDSEEISFDNDLTLFSIHNAENSSSTASSSTSSSHSPEQLHISKAIKLYHEASKCWLHISRSDGYEALLVESRQQLHNVNCTISFKEEDDINDLSNALTLSRVQPMQTLEVLHVKSFIPFVEKLVKERIQDYGAEEGIANLQVSDEVPLVSLIGQICDFCADYNNDDGRGSRLSRAAYVSLSRKRAQQHQKLVRQTGLFDLLMKFMKISPSSEQQFHLDVKKDRLFEIYARINDRLHSHHLAGVLRALYRMMNSKYLRGAAFDPLVEKLTCVFGI